MPGATTSRTGIRSGRRADRPRRALYLLKHRRDRHRPVDRRRRLLVSAIYRWAGARGAGDIGHVPPCASPGRPDASSPIELRPDAPVGAMFGRSRIRTHIVPWPSRDRARPARAPSSGNGRRFSESVDATTPWVACRASTRPLRAPATRLAADHAHPRPRRHAAGGAAHARPGLGTSPLRRQHRTDRAGLGGARAIAGVCKQGLVGRHTPPTPTHSCYAYEPPHELFLTKQLARRYPRV